jgi:hypothetical protein
LPCLCGFFEYVMDHRFSRYCGGTVRCTSTGLAGKASMGGRCCALRLISLP